MIFEPLQLFFLLSKLVLTSSYSFRDYTLDFISERIGNFCIFLNFDIIIQKSSGWFPELIRAILLIVWSP